MRTLASLLLALVLFGAITGALTILHQTVPFGYWPGVALLGLAAIGCGWVAGWNARDAFSGLIGGILVTLALWKLDQHSTVWASTVFHGPLLTLNSDEVLLGLSLTLFGFLQGARWGEAASLRQLRQSLQAAAGVVPGAGPWPSEPPPGRFPD